MKRGIVFLASLSIVLGLVAAAPGPAAIPPSSPGNCTVTNTSDSDSGSLRDCMDQLVAGDVITFDPGVFPPDNPQTITLDAFPLPDIVTDNVTIDGSNAGVVLNGSGLGFGCGLVISDTNNVVIKGLQILNFPGDGISLQNGASNNTIGGVNGSPGGACTGDCNLISGNGGMGVFISGSGTTDNTVSGNYIGTNFNGTAVISNTYNGVYIKNGASYNLIGGDTPGERNLISGNGRQGVSIRYGGTMSNTVSGNYIGTDASGTAALGNSKSGVRIGDGAQYNVIGGSNASSGDSCSGDCNLLSGNGTDHTDHGVDIYGSDTTNNIVSGNYIGTNIPGTASIGNTGSGVMISDDAQYNVIGGDTPGERNLLSGNDRNGVSIRVSGTEHNQVIGNYIGTDASGTAAVGSGSLGVWIGAGAQYNIIGGATDDERNIISGNNNGVGIDSSSNNIVIGNYIGTDINGTAAIGNTYSGVLLWNGASYNLIGGDTTGERNLISGNGDSGVTIRDSGTMSNTVSGNYIGTDVSGTAALRNSEGGVSIFSGAQYNVIGGSNPSSGDSCSGDCNLISGNGTTYRYDHGVYIGDSGTTNNIVSGNYIGTDINGTVAISNTGSGVFIDTDSQYNVIGGITDGERNLISGNGTNGVSIRGGAMSNIVIGNYIGTDASGTAAVGNGSLGVWLSGAQHNVIGGDTPDERNIISGNGDGVGIGSDAMNNTVIGNYIGTDISGAAAIGNTYSGVLLWNGPRYNMIGGDTAGERNLISGNGESGVTIRDSGTMSNTVSGNYIGTDASSTVAIPNNGFGVEIGDGAQYNVIGGDATGERNLISGNGIHGMSIWGSSTMNNVVSGNYIGTDTSGTAAIGNVGCGIWVDGAQDTIIGGDTAGERNLISGNSGGGVCMGGSVTMKNTVSGNYIGTDASGTAALGNSDDGVYLCGGAQYNVIGGDMPSERNLISGNGLYGVKMRGDNTTISNIVIGNYIGTDASGTAAIGNTEGGVYISKGGSYNVIGGETPGERNLISGNGITYRYDHGVYIGGDGTTGNTVSGNYIGTDINGTVAISNAGSGVFIGDGAQYTVIGGVTDSERNLISGNGTNGVSIRGAMSNTVIGNYIGTDASGTAAVGNGSLGVWLSDAQHNVIGGDTPDERNIISGNGDGVGIGSGAMNNTVIGNYIGTDISGTAAIGNTYSGVLLWTGAGYNLIGGNTPGVGNTIAFNNGNGVAVDNDVLGISALSNTIFSNGGLGIDLGLDGVTANDAGDGDTGANNLQNFPVLTSATSDATSTTIEGVLNSTPNTTFRLEFFSNTACDPSGFGEGETLLGSTTVATDGSGDASFTVAFPTSVPRGQFVSATATDPDDNTSEFCQCLEVTAQDVDEDGVSDEVEDGAPNGGDGNNDGIPDSQQGNVASLPNAQDARYVTLASPDGTSLSNVQAVENPSPGDAPPAVEFPVGFFEFTVMDLASGGSVAVTLLLPPGETVDTYYKYGPTPGDPTDHWYEFLFDGTTGAEILADRVVLHFVDGQRGDDDLTANGEVVEPGSPGLIQNQPPTADAGGPYTADEGDTITLDASGSSDPDGNIILYEWDLDNDGEYDDATGVTTDVVFEDNGSYTIGLKVTDGFDESDADTAEVMVLNVAPTVDTPAVAPEPSDEGGTVTAGATFSDPGVKDAPFTCSVDYGDGSGNLTGTVSGNTCTSPAYTYSDNGSYSVTVSVTDKDGDTGNNTAVHVVNNVAPTVGEISAPVDPVEVDMEISISADFTDPGLLDTHTAEWDWGDDSTSTGIVNEADGSGSVSGSHMYSTPGVYTVKLTVTDDDGGSGESIFQYVVVYDPEGGFVTGGGWINSPAGAYVPDPLLTGKATFGFVAKYKKGTDTPTGETEFRFRVADLNFHSDTYQWLVVAGHKAQFKGTGTINGEGNYGFMLTAVDEALTPSTEVDKFRIKIWDKDSDDTIVYDNQMGESDEAEPATDIGGGSIVIHKAK